MREIRELREIDLKRKIIRVTVEDHFGARQVIHIGMQSDQCSKCKRPYAVTATGEVDVDETIDAIAEDQAPHHDKAIRSFERASVDMTAVKARREEHNAAREARKKGRRTVSKEGSRSR